MQTFEALLSLMIAFSMVIVFVTLPEQHYSFTLPQYLIAEDAWRVLYLRHGLSMFYPMDNSLSQDISTMSSLASICISYSTPFFSTPECNDINRVVIKEERIFGDASTLIVSGKD